MTLGPWSILRERDYALVWSAGALSDMGTWMQIAALSIFVTESTGQQRWTAIASTVVYVTAGLCEPYAGILSDHHDRRRLLIVSALAQALIGSVLVFCFASAHTAPWLLIALAGAQGAVGAAGVPALNAMVPDLVPRRSLPNAAFLEQISWNTGRALGPPVAVLVVHLSSYPVVFALNAATFIAMAVAVFAVRGRPVVTRDEGSVIERFGIGWRGLMASDVGRLTTLLTLAEMALIAPAIALIPAMAQLTFHGSGADSAALFFALGVGCIAGLLLTGSLMHRVGQLDVFAALLMALPVFLALYALSPTEPLAIVAIIPYSAAHSALFALGASIVQQRVPAQIRGRVLALRGSILTVGYGVASPLLGRLGDAAGLRVVLIGCAVSAAALFLGSGGVRRIRALRGEAAAGWYGSRGEAV